MSWLTSSPLSTRAAISFSTFALSIAAATRASHDAGEMRDRTMAKRGRIGTYMSPVRSCRGPCCKAAPHQDRLS